MLLLPANKNKEYFSDAREKSTEHWAVPACFEARLAGVPREPNNDLRSIPWIKEYWALWVQV